MKKSNWIIIVIVFTLVAVFPSCSDTDTLPDYGQGIGQPGEGGGGDDDEEPIILGDTTQINP